MNTSRQFGKNPNERAAAEPREHLGHRGADRDDESLVDDAAALRRRGPVPRVMISGWTRKIADADAVDEAREHAATRERQRIATTAPGRAPGSP